MPVTDKIEDMTLDSYVPSDDKSRCNYNVVLQVVTNPSMFRMAFFDFPAADSLHIFHGMRHYWRNRDDSQQ